MMTAPTTINEHVFIGCLFSKFLLIGCRACQRSPFESRKKLDEMQFFYGFSNSNAQRDHGVDEPKRCSGCSNARPANVMSTASYRRIRQFPVELFICKKMAPRVSENRIFLCKKSNRAPSPTVRNSPRPLPRHSAD